MQIKRFPLGQLQANCFFLLKNNNCLIVDPGDSADFILEQVMQQNLQVQGILATHGHFDHILAAGEVQLSLESFYKTTLPLRIHKDDLFLVKRLRETANHFLGMETAALPIKHFDFINDGELNIGDFNLKVLHTPGHTPGSCSFYFPEENIVFTGDTLFKEGIGSYDHPYSDKKLLEKSVARLLSLDEMTVIYPGHGEETSVQDMI